MSEQASLLSEDAPRAAVIRHLRTWSARHQPGAGDPPGGGQLAALLATLLAAVEEGSPGSWERFCEVVHASGLHMDMLATTPGLWSHCRLAAGPAWNGIATMTRGLIRHLGAVPDRFAAQEVRQPAPGVGCVMIDGERLWLADHLLYACQDDLEIGLDCRFYGYARDPDLHGIAEHRQQWSFVQRRWLTVMAGLRPGQLPEAGWISSPRWLFPLPAHALPRHALTCPLGRRLESAALTAADGCATGVSSRPWPWWSDHRLVPAPQQAGRWAAQWAARERRGGFGVQSPDALAARSVDDPCLVPMILAVQAPGADLVGGRVWALIAGLIGVLQRQLAAQPALRDDAPACSDLARPCGGHRLVVERNGAWRAANGWAISRALGLVGFMPAFHHLQGLVDWPPSTLLRSGLAEVLIAHAVRRSCDPVSAVRIMEQTLKSGNYPGRGPIPGSRWCRPAGRASSLTGWRRRWPVQAGSRPRAGRPMRSPPAGEPSWRASSGDDFHRALNATCRRGSAIDRHRGCVRRQIGRSYRARP